MFQTSSLKSFISPVLSFLAFLTVSLVIGPAERGWDKIKATKAFVAVAGIMGFGMGGENEEIRQEGITQIFITQNLRRGCQHVYDYVKYNFPTNRIGIRFSAGANFNPLYTHFSINRSQIKLRFTYGSKSYTKSYV
jgi:hypothetical protein